MPSITATTKKLKVAGANGKRVDLLGKYITLSEAVTAISTGAILPDSDSTNVKSIVEVFDNSGWKIYEWSHTLQAFTQIGRGDGSTALADAYIRLAGTDEYITFQKIPDGDVADFLMNFAKDFTMTISIPLVDTPESGQQVKLFSNGQNSIQFAMGANNYGIYVNDGSINAGANTWYEFTANNELTFVHVAADKELKYYVNGNWKATVNLSNRSNNKDGKFSIGGLVGANLLKGGVDTFAAWDIAISNNDLQEIKDGVALEERTVYSDCKVHCPLGEDVYPYVSDKKGNLEDGILMNGSPDDFIEIQ